MVLPTLQAATLIFNRLLFSVDLETKNTAPNQCSWGENDTLGVQR